MLASSGLARAAANATGDLADALRAQVRAESVALIHGVVDAQSHEQAEAAPAALLRHPQGAAIGQFLNQHLYRLLVHVLACDAELQRVTPEWYWRDFRLRHGRNHRSEQLLERAALVWAIYHNFEPT